MKVLVDRTAVALAVPKKKWIVLPKQSDLYQLIETLAERYDTSLMHELTADGMLADGMLVLINGQSVHQMNGIHTQLSDGDRVYFVVMVHGG